jgi:hypothetical protein
VDFRGRFQHAIARLMSENPHEPSRRAAPGRFRRWFRRFRILVLLVALAFVGAVVYLNLVGLPEVLKNPLIHELQARGLKLEFKRLRLDWRRGLVAEQVVMAEARGRDGPTIEFGEVILEPDWRELSRLRFDLRALRLRDGILMVPIAADDTSPFRVDAVEAELRFLNEDRWELAHFAAAGLGLRLQASGILTNASAVRDWTRGVSGTSTLASSAWQSHLRRAMAYARLWRYGQPPVLNIRLAGDARDPAGIRADLYLAAESIQSRWGTLESLNVRGRLNQPSGVAGLGRSEVLVTFRGAQTVWSTVQEGQWDVEWTQAFTNMLPADLKWLLYLGRVQSPWGETPQAFFELHAYQDARFPGQLTGDLAATSDTVLGGLARAETNQLMAKVRLDPVTYLPTTADYQYSAANIRFNTGAARAVQLHGAMRLRDEPTRVSTDSGWGWWAGFEPFELSGEGRIQDLEVRGVNFETVDLDVAWNAPELRVNRLRLERPDGSLEGVGTVHIPTREANATANLTFDLHAIEPLLTPKTVRWLGQYAWVRPPRIEASARAILPGWNSDRPDWRRDVLPTLHLEGHLEAGRASFRGVEADAVDLRFIHTNRVWHLPQLVATRPEGRLEFSYTEDTVTRDYHFHGASAIDPLALRPLLGAKADKAFDVFSFTTPPRLTGDVWGRWRARERVDVRAQLSATQFSIRGEPVDELQAALHFTNGFLAASGVQLRTGEESVNAPAVGFRLEDQRLFLTNATGRIDPMKVARAIGPKTASTLEPYKFVNPPQTRVNGSVDVRKTRNANLQFEVGGGPFHYWRFRMSEVEAVVGWTNDTVAIGTADAAFYNGQLSGRISVDVSPASPTPFQFEARVNRADFHELLSDVHNPTNRVEGELSVDLAITHADARDWRSWQGFGQLELRDGFLWGIPTVGVFSPVLDALLPGVGRSRISGATATFTITNSIIFTDDLELRAPLFRLAYRGASDFDGRISARVEARLLRDAWLVGPLVSVVLTPLSKILEYEVTGTLDEPHLELIHVPKPLQVPFNPIRTLRELFEQPPRRVPPGGP